MNGLHPVLFAQAIADSTRQRIMRFCCCDWRSVGEISREIRFSQPTASHHLAILRKAGLVKTRREGKLVLYMLDQGKMVSCCGGLMLAFAPWEKVTRTIQKCC